MACSKPCSSSKRLFADFFAAVRTVKMDRCAVRFGRAHLELSAITLGTTLLIVTSTVWTQQIEIPTPLATDSTPGHSI